MKRSRPKKVRTDGVRGESRYRTRVRARQVLARKLGVGLLPMPLLKVIAKGR